MKILATTKIFPLVGFYPVFMVRNLSTNRSTYSFSLCKFLHCARYPPAATLRLLRRILHARFDPPFEF